MFSNGPVTRCMFSHSWSLDMYAQVEVVFSYKWPLDLNCFRIDFQIFVRFRTDGIVIIRFRIEYLCFRTGLSRVACFRTAGLLGYILLNRLTSGIMFSYKWPLDLNFFV